MAHIVRPLLLQWPRCQHQYCCARAAFYHFLTSSRLLSNSRKSHHRHQLPPLNSSFPFSYRSVHSRSGAVHKFRGLPVVPYDSSESDGESSDGNAKKSRNARKREAKRTVRWGMELADFSPPQIKRILKVALLEREVYEAIMLVKRLGRDVREGKRRQFAYIGRLLRGVDPELMDDLIQATKDGDQSKFQDLSGSDIEDGEDEAEETEDEYEELESEHHIEVSTRWFDGLINKDIDIMNEIYSLQDVDFDRQELRRLVRELHSVQERLASSEEKGGKLDKGVAGAQRSLTRYLRGIAKQLPVE